MSRIVVIAPHPDDETLGSGGTLLKCSERGDKIHWIIVTNISSREGYTDEQVTSRQSEIDNVAQQFGFDDIFKLDFPTTAIDQISLKLLVDKLNTVITKIKPDTVILPYKNDVHSDHRIVFDAAYSCTKIFRQPTIKNIMMMEVLSETDFAAPDMTFSPNYFVDISPFLEKKLNILKIYRSEIGSRPFPRSLESVSALAALRGAQAGCRYAESFMLLKSVN